jgi:hypothetical protein
MDPLTFASSRNEESDFAAERRWESESGIRDNFDRHCVTIGRKTPQLVRREARWRHSATKFKHMHLIQFREIMRDAEVAYAIHPIVRRYRLSAEDTTKALIACGVPRPANVAQITSALI